MIQNIILTLLLVYVLAKLLLFNFNWSSRKKRFLSIYDTLIGNPIWYSSLFNMFILYDADKTRNLMARLSDIAALVTLLSFYIYKKLIAEQEFNYSLWVCAGWVRIRGNI